MSEYIYTYIHTCIYIYLTHFIILKLLLTSDLIIYLEYNARRSWWFLSYWFSINFWQLHDQRSYTIFNTWVPLFPKPLNSIVEILWSNKAKITMRKYLWKLKNVNALYTSGIPDARLEQVKRRLKFPNWSEQDIPEFMTQT